MSEKEKEIEEEEEEGIIDHWSHEHQLSLVETSGKAQCYVCEVPFRSDEQAYGCSKQRCEYTKLLHKECAEMPRKITHSWHHDNQHVLIIQHAHSQWSRCRICYQRKWSSIGYKCTSSECEEIEMHMRCARAYGMMEAVDDDDDDRSTIHHRSHPPNHQLMFVERGSSFMCDACGITSRGKSYICTSCRYWIHERCAALPRTIKREDHHHTLSLSFRVPSEYLRYKYRCEVCNKVFLISRNWIYHCELCRYAVHIKCAFKIKTTISNATNEKDIVRLPTDDVAEELIRPFVMRQGRAITPIIPLHDDDNDNEMVKYKFMPHEHELTLISSSSSHHHHQKEKGEDEEDSDEDEEEDWGKRSELICDGCITPILSSSSSSSDKSSSSSSYYYSYMSCGECKYNLHLACFNLPPRLPSLPLLHHHEADSAENELVLISCPKHKPWDSWGFRCSVCRLFTNGLMYGCSKCDFKADVKCASLPQTIHHAAHQQNPLNLLTPHDIESNNLSWRTCDAGCLLYSPLLEDSFCYADSSYEFAVHVQCAMLPASVKSPLRWDRHHPRMPLTYNANINHPGEFYCDECETEMNPKSWMYHCRLCDLSFHPKCFSVDSGFYKNKKFEQEYTIDKAVHPHTLTYQLLTTKHRCDTCHRDNCYGWLGFLCASCNFFICFLYCGEEMERLGTLHPID